MTNPSRAEPFAGREDVSLPAHVADLGARRHRETGSAMEPAKSRETTTILRLFEGDLGGYKHCRIG